MTSVVDQAGETVYSFSADGGTPDFTVRSTQDKSTIFLVQRAALAAGSQVFKDMFSTCDPLDSTAWIDVTDASNASKGLTESLESSQTLQTTDLEIPTESMEMGEGADVLQMLFRVLHEAPVPLPSAKEMSKWEKLPAYYKEYKEKLRMMEQASPTSPSEEGAASVSSPNQNAGDAEGQGQGEINGDSILQPPIASASAVPLPLLRKLFILADKWDFSPSINSTLQTHLVAHSFEQPLEVYGLAYALGFDDVAAFASTQLHSPPLETYHPDTLARTLPDIQSLQKLYILHAERKRQLRTILSDEPLYPHGYGKCTTRGHADALEEAWRKQKRFVLSMDRVHAGTDLAGEMSSSAQGFADCKTCRGRISAVTKMLQYKSGKIPRSIAKLNLPAVGVNNAPNAGEATSTQ